MTSGAERSLSVGQGKRLLLAVAHPDDEAFGLGSTLAKYAAQGVEVTLVCATLGEAGEIAPGSEATRDTLGEVRERELRTSAAVLGIKHLVLSGYRDSGMAGSEDNYHPEAFVNAPRDDVVSSLVEAMRHYRPHVVITFDSGGGYGHPDHMLISEATTKAFGLSAEDAHSALGPPWRPDRLYYMAFPRSMVLQFARAMRALDPDSDLAKLDPEQMGVPDETITTVIDAADYAGVQMRAAAEHRSQHNPFDMFPADVRDQILGRDHFVRVMPTMPESAEGLESDLFEGL